MGVLALKPRLACGSCLLLIGRLVAAQQPASAGAGGASVDPDRVIIDRIPRYAVDLALPPQQRWAPVLDDFLRHKGTAPFVKFFTSIWMLLELEDHGVFAFYRQHLGQIERAYADLYHDVYGEIRALAEALQAHSGPLEREALTWERVFLGQLHMQMENIGPKLGECTSIVARLPEGILHARNWDFGPEPAALGAASVTVDFHSAGTNNFTCLLALTHITKWTTCVRPGAFSLSLNAREYGEGFEQGRSPSVELQLLQAGHLPRVELLRRIMAAGDFQSAVATAALARPLTSLYAILADGSPGQGKNGAVVTVKGNGESADVLHWPGPTEADNWFLVQTNVDHWVPTSPNASSSHRRDHMRSLLRSMGPNATAEQVLQALKNSSVFPAGNTGFDNGRVFRDSTIASVLMHPAATTTSDELYTPFLWKTLPPSPHEVAVAGKLPLLA